MMPPSHYNKDVYKSYTLFLGLRDGSNNPTRNWLGIRTWGSWLGQGEIQEVKYE
jgi:hypothetical protein